MEKNFDSIRPYLDFEIPAAVERLAQSPYLDDIAQFLKLNSGGEELKNILYSCSKVNDFQNNIMAFIVGRILKNTANNVTYGGLHYFEGGQKHVIITNHRDIVLDSAIIQLILHNHQIKTTEIAVGDNLITSQFIEDVARSNKMIKVTRSRSPLELYNSSVLLSSYIREKVANGISSIWIAQRNGRTKDGNDLTEQGLLKMLDLSGEKGFVKNMQELEILPVAISYEYEPCDAFKTHELYVSRRQKYVKGEQEDFNSILMGMTQYKGNIHFEFTEPVTHEEVEYCSQFAKNVRFLELAKIIDKQIHSTYKLWPNNYIAADLLKKDSKQNYSFEDKYTQEQKMNFIEYANKQISTLEGDKDELLDIFLHIYANPVFNKS